MKLDDPIHGWIIGDIHGCATQLDEVLSHIDREIKPHEYVICLGDYIDRGPDSKRVVDLLLDFKMEYGERLICLKGNHEQWFLEMLADRKSLSWLTGMEGLTTVKSYSLRAAMTIAQFLVHQGPELLQSGDYQLPLERFLDAMPGEHLDFFRRELVNYVEAPNLICSHSGLEIGKPMEEQTEADLFWSRPKQMLREWPGPQFLAVGHLPTLFVNDRHRGQPIVHNHLALIDTGVSMTGVLTTLHIPSLSVMQAFGPNHRRV